MKARTVKEASKEQNLRMTTKAENSKEEAGGLYPMTRGETLKHENRAAESEAADCKPESPTGTSEMMERICESRNVKRAVKQVVRNKGSSGIDGMRTEEFAGYLTKNWHETEKQLLAGEYKPSPVRRVEIPKRDGGVRKLGIPTVLDRFIQQAVMQVLQEEYDKTFSNNSYGFRPGKSAQEAVKRAQEYITAGNAYVVDIDLEKFFDRVNHDRLMSRLAKRIEDKRLLKLIRAFLNAGVLEEGEIKPTEEGTPQGGNLSPLLSNIVLDELDKELEKRGHKFVRYADDCNVYVKSERAGIRVKESLARFITKKLKLKVNEKKSAVDKPSKRKILGFSFTGETKPRIRISPKSLEVFKERIKDITRRRRGISLEKMVNELNKYIKGWMGYYGICQTLTVLSDLDSWIKRRIRCFIWKKWKTFRNRVRELKRGGVTEREAAITALWGGIWKASNSKALKLALPNRYFETIGVLSLKSLVKV
jgi:RNA-directed DNA polymerase